MRLLNRSKHAFIENSSTFRKYIFFRCVKGCTKVLTAPSGDIFSPNYGPGQKYPGNLACKWTIKAPRRKKINLIFKDFLIEKTQSCRGDRLLLYDGQNATSQLVGKYCSAKPSPFTSSSNYIHMEFYSDRSLGFKGFYAFYSISLPTTGILNINMIFVHVKFILLKILCCFIINSVAQCFAQLFLSRYSVLKITLEGFFNINSF